jgi:hypothetical protein
MQFLPIYIGHAQAYYETGSPQDGASLVPGSAFLFDMTAMPGYQWEVTHGGEFFNFAALYATWTALRTGNVELELLNDGVSVFAHSEAGIKTFYNHVGTNSVNLPTGTVFDEVRMHYLLLSATSDGRAVGTTLLGQLPTDGAPDHFPGIVFVSRVDEPEGLAMIVVGLGILGFRVTRRRLRVL